MKQYTFCAGDQGSEEWICDRLGCVTGSMADVLYMSGRTKGTESTTRINYRYALAEERITGQAQADQFMSKAMRDGITNEPFARMMYEGETGIDVETAPFLRLTGMWAGCSLDGMVRSGGRIEGIQEFKSPMLKTHAFYHKAKVLPEDYRYQVIHNLWCTEADWCDFASYREGFRLFLIRVHARDMPLEEHGRKVEDFLREVDDCEEEIRSLSS